jgi:hypothetical protein
MENGCINHSALYFNYSSTFKTKKMKAKETNHPAEKMLQVRANTSLYLLQNPNYFGTSKDDDILKLYKPVFPLAQSTYYEALGCVSYNPAKKVLNAVVRLNHQSGYSGSACQGGSREYVRFYVDYNDDGNWVDEGLAFVGVYDRSFPDIFCYNVNLTITPNVTRCCDSKPVLPKVRAILSWNTIPPDNSPNWTPIWGDVKEAYVQIAPRKDWLCLFNKFNKALDVKEFINNPSLIAKMEMENPSLKDLTPGKAPELSVKELKELSRGKKIEDHRIITKTYAKLQQSHAQSHLPVELSELQLGWKDINDFYAAPKFNTSYEELKCVSLNKDQSALHASVEIKKETGYSGGLCTAGSKEYVAFYMDFGSGWVYMGTSFANTHDIDSPKNQPLWYDVVLPVNIEKHRKEWCAVGKAKLKGILSWNVPPTPNNPNYVSPWGDWEECIVEIKPLPKGVTDGKVLPFIEKLGGMIVTDINNSTGLATTSGGSSSLSGAEQSPFDGRIELNGHIFNAGANMKYRLLLTEPGGATGKVMVAQNIDTDFFGTITHHKLIPDVDGWMDYLEVGGTNIVADLLANLYPGAEGLYKIAIEAKDGVGTIYTGNSVSFFVDKKAPLVAIDITNGSGNCGVDFKPGDTLTGTYSVSDSYLAGFSMQMTPAQPGTSIKIDGMAVSSIDVGTSVTAKSGTWELKTTAGVTPSCGYNIRMDVSDRAIINSGYIGHYNAAIQGFCLNKA